MDTTRVYFVEYDYPDEKLCGMAAEGDPSTVIIVQLMPLLAARVREFAPAVAAFRDVRLVRGEYDPLRMTTRFRLEAVPDTCDKPDEKRSDAVSRDFEVTLTVEAGRVIAAIEALTATLMRLGLIVEYPALLSKRLTEEEGCGMIKNVIVAQRKIGHPRVRDGIATVIESTWTDQSKTYDIYYPNGTIGRLPDNVRPPIDIPQDRFDKPPPAPDTAVEAALALAVARNEAQDTIRDLAGLFAELSEFTPLPDYLSACDFGRRAYIVVSQLAETFPYSFEELMPLIDITQDEVLIRSVLGDYVGQYDGLTRARETLLTMREDDGG